MKADDRSKDRSIDRFKSYYVMLRYSLLSFSGLLSLSRSRAYSAFLGLTTGSGCIRLYIYRMFSMRDTVHKDTSTYDSMTRFTWYPRLVMRFQ